MDYLTGGSSKQSAPTKGPWTVEDMNIIGPGGTTIATVYEASDFPCIDVDETSVEAVQAECEANTRLIAAAPEMLEILKYARDKMLGNGPSITALRERTNALLTKVTARTPANDE